MTIAVSLDKKSTVQTISDAEVIRTLTTVLTADLELSHPMASNVKCVRIQM